MIEVRELVDTEIDAVDVRELTDTEVESVCGGVSDLGKYITKAVDDALSAAIGGNSGIVHPGMPGHIQPYQIDPGMTPQQL